MDRLFRSIMYFMFILVILVCIFSLVLAYFNFFNISNQAISIFNETCTSLARVVPSDSTISNDLKSYLNQLESLNKSISYSDIITFLFNIFSVVFIVLGAYYIERTQKNLDSAKEKLDEMKKASEDINKQYIDVTKKSATIQNSLELLKDNVTRYNDTRNYQISDLNTRIENANSKINGLREEESKITNSLNIRFKVSELYENMTIAYSITLHIDRLVNDYEFTKEFKANEIISKNNRDKINAYIPRLRDKLRSLEIWLEKNSAMSTDTVALKQGIFYNLLDEIVEVIQNTSGEIISDEVKKELIGRCYNCNSMLNKFLNAY